MAIYEYRDVCASQLSDGGLICVSIATTDEIIVLTKDLRWAARAFVAAVQGRRSALREHLAFKVRACRECNEAKGTRLLVPPSHAHIMEQLEAITMGTYRVWHGDAEALREVVK